MNVTTAMQMTVGTNTPETLSAIFAIGAFVAAASLTMRIIWESVVSSPTRVASQRKKPDWFTVAAETASPTALSTGMLSPVRADSLTALAPSKHHAVYGDILTGAHDKHIAAAEPRETGTVTSLTVPHEHGGFRREVHEAL